MGEIECVSNPKCREDLMGRMVTKRMAWCLIVVLMPICFASLGVSLKVWGITEFYAVDQIKKSTIKLEAVDEKTTRMETQLMFLNDRIDKQLDRIKKLEVESDADSKEILYFLRKLNSEIFKGAHR